MIYNKINDFCKVRNTGNCFSNGIDPTPRVKFIMDLLDSEGIKYELDIFEEENRYRPFIKRNKDIEKDSEKDKNRKRGRYNLSRFSDFNKKRDLDETFLFDDDFDDYWKNYTPPKNNFFNIIMKGSSNKMIVAHHDVNNPTIDNANDNSASVINVIATKKLRPYLNAVLLDGEEFGGIGSQHLSKQINEGKFGNIEWVLNYELTGKGGKYFFIGDYPGKLTNHIKSIFDCPIIRTPFNDSFIFNKNGIDSTVINPVPPMSDGKKSDVVFPDGTYLDTSILHNCHSSRDNLSSISVDDMREFVEEVILKIV